MKNDSGSSERSEDLLIEARRWVVQLRSGEVSQSDVDALTRWRNESPGHRRAFAEANAQWAVLQLAARNVARREEHATPLPAFMNRQLSRRAWLGGAMAASLGGAGYLTIWPPFDLWPSLSELTADYRTDIGERREIAFADRVSVELNTRTSLTVARTRPEMRQIELVSGEIVVTAGLGEASPSQPFVVVAGDGRISAVRATFDLRHDGKNVWVVCLDGKVQVECQNDNAMLKAQQQIVYGARGLSSIAATDGRDVEGWRRGLLIFDNQPLSQVIPEINRYRRGRIVLMSDRIGRLPLVATFRLDRIDEVVPKIVDIFSLKATTLPGGVVLLS
jgi:transmembrane sensor